MDCERVPLLSDPDNQVKRTRKWGNTEGRVAWLVAFSLFLVNAVVLGQGRVASILYVDFIQEFQIDRKLASVPYSVQESTRMLFAPVAGMLSQRIDISWVAVLGCVVTALSCATCYFTHDFEWIILMWGGIYGLGAAFVSTISMIVIEQYFTKNRSSAMGLAFSGTCVGALFFPALVDVLVEKYEIRGTFLIMGSIILHAIPIALLLGERSIVDNEVEIKSGKRHRIKPNYNSLRDKERSIEGGLEGSGFSVNSNYNSLPDKEGSMESGLERSGYSVNSNYNSLSDKEGSMEGGLEGSGYSDKSETSKVTRTKIIKKSSVSSLRENLSNKTAFDPLKISMDTKQKNILEVKVKENVSSSPNLRIANNESKKESQNDFETKRDNDTLSEIAGSILNVEKSVKIKSIGRISKESIVVDCPDSDYNNVLQSYLLKASAHAKDLEYEINPLLASTSKALNCEENISSRKELLSSIQQKEHLIFENLSNKADFDPLKFSIDTKKNFIFEEKMMKKNVSSSPKLGTGNNESKKDGQIDFERKRDNDSFSGISGSILNVEKSVKLKSIDSISKESIVVDCPDSDYNNVLQSYLLKASAHTKDLEYEKNPLLASTSKALTCEELISSQKELPSTKQQKELIFVDLSNKTDFDPLKVSKNTKQKDILEEEIKENVSSSPNLGTENYESRKNNQNDFDRKRDNDSFSEISASILDAEKSVEIKSIDSTSKESILLADSVVDSADSINENALQSYLLKASTRTQYLENDRNPCLASISKAFTCDESISSQKELTSAKQQKESLIFEHLSNKADFDPLKVSKDTKRRNILEEKMKENLSSSPNLRTANNESKKNSQNDFERKRDNDSFSEISGSVLDVEKSVETKSIDSISKESILLADSVVDSLDSGNKNALQSDLLKASAHTTDLENEINPCLASTPKAFICKENDSFQKHLTSTKQQKELLIFEDWAFKGDCTVNVDTNRDSVKFRTPRSSEITLDFKELYKNKDLVLDLLSKKIPIGNDEIILLENELTQNCLETSDLEFIFNELQRIEYYFQKPDVEKQQFLTDLRHKLKQFKYLQDCNSSEIFQGGRHENKGCYYKDIRTVTNEKSIYTLEITEYSLEIPVDLYIPIKLQELSKRSSEYIESYYSGEKRIRKVLGLLLQLHEILNSSSDTKLDALFKYSSYETKNFNEITNDEDGKKIIRRYPDTFYCYMLTALKLYINPMFLLVCLSRALTVITFLTVITSVVDFSMDKGMAKSNGKYVIATLSAGDLIGRLCTGWITDKGYISDAKFMVLGLFLQAGFTAILPQTKSTTSFLSVLTAFAALQGTLFVKHPVVLLKYLREHEKYMGLAFMNFSSGLIGFIIPSYIGYVRDYLKAYDMLYYINGALSGAVGFLWLLEPCLRILVPVIRD